MLKKMLTPIVMGMAFMGMAATVNVAIAEDVVDSMQVLVDEMSMITIPPATCEQCALNVKKAIGFVASMNDMCNALEQDLEETRSYCKTQSATPNTPFKAKCDALTDGFYSQQLADRQSCRDLLGSMVTTRNNVEHACYGAPLYCGNIPGFPGIYW